MSVLIPVFNGERYLAETIESVLSQSWRPLEIIVVDDGSTDRSAAIADRFGPPVVCVRNSHCGLAASRNLAMRHAHGEYFHHHDADDLSHDNAIAARMAVFETCPEVDIVVGNFSLFLSPDLNEAERARILVPAETRRGHVNGCSIIRKRLFDRLGVFNEVLRTSGDLDWFIRATEAGARIHHYPEVVIHRRIHLGNLSRSFKQTADAERFQLLKASLGRRRANAPSSDL